MKRLQQSIAVGAALVAGDLALLGANVSAAPINPVNEATKGVTKAGGSPQSGSFAELIQSVIQILLFVIGAVSVIMIIIGGIEYVTSAGDPAKTKKAKDTVLYSIVGLVVALLAYAIVYFVLQNIT